ncbi:hypothetical protein N7466_002965 [Penicillium verhagenii]|uniref:uncharacterized protein n=1 Tax=Penicillium verhagenii TaxID=1562060 RepID=UPI002545414F|nr:uncharacterized protein N7466_002965 [Penicillium verhagenii]KAJ5939831.1 hypothetical protein N7466_002965 [Penicillium verhagenii]
MAPSNPLANWEKVGDSFYRKIPDMTPILDEEAERDCRSSVSCTVELSALYRDESKPIRLDSQASVEYRCLFLLRKANQSINWNSHHPRVGSSKRSIVVAEDGIYLAATWVGWRLASFLLKPPKDIGVILVIRSCGMLNNSSLQFESSDEPRPQALAPCPEGESHHGIDFHPPNPFTLVEVLFAVDKTVHLIDSTEAEDKTCKMVHQTCYTRHQWAVRTSREGKFWVVSNDFQESKLSNID